LLELLQYELTVKLCLKFNLFLECKYIDVHGDYSAYAFKTANTPIYYATSMEHNLEEMFRKLSQDVENHEGKGSGWTLDEVESVELRDNKFKVLKASSNFDLPPNIQNTLAITNPHNLDQQCFKWAVLATFPHEHPERVQNLIRYQDRYNWENASFPTDVKDTNKFERDNGITINEFALDEENKGYPPKVVDDVKPDHRELLIVQDEEDTHYCLINNFNTILRS
jgi:hypothetical protein